MSVGSDAKWACRCRARRAFGTQGAMRASPRSRRRPFGGGHDRSRVRYAAVPAGCSRATRAAARRRSPREWSAG